MQRRLALVAKWALDAMGVVDPASGFTGLLGVCLFGVSMRLNGKNGGNGASMTALHTWIRHGRETRGLSQAKLAAMTGLTQAQLSNWELGKSRPSDGAETLVKKAFQKFDADKADGRHVEYLSKTRWSQAYLGSTRAGVRRKDIGAAEAASYVARVTGPWSHSKLMRNTDQPVGSAISLFSGCGGLTAGFAYAGFDIVGHVELEGAAREVFSANFPGSRLLGEDVRSVSDSTLSAVAQSRLVDVVFGGPPCQGFSLTGKRDVYDPRNQLYREMARVVGLVEPQVFVMENVRLLTSMKTPDGSPLIDDVYRTFEGLGYKVVHKELNATSFGVPQFRERVFFIGSRNSAITPSLPASTHGDSKSRDDLFGSQCAPIGTVRDAIGDLEELESGQASTTDPLHFAVSHPSHVIDMLRDVPEGQSAHENPDPGRRPKSGYNTTYKRLEWNEPCSTISTTFGMISGSRNVHPTATRSLTIREAARCQTFPDDYVFFGRLGDIRTMIGNAVPPMLGKSIGEHIGRLLRRAAD